MTIPPKVSIIIPVYNAEKYIEKCVRSLFRQTLDSLEYVFVDDCTPDRSIEIMQRVLEEYPDRKSQVKLIRHEINLGVSRSRQDGIDVATGKYIIHCDPDDWVELDMYERMYAKAQETGADIVLCDYINEFGKKSILDSQEPIELTSESLLASIVGASFHKLHGSLCNKMIKSSCYTECRIPDGISFCEDVFALMQILSTDRKIAYLPVAFYHYRKDNMNSLTSTTTKDQLKDDRLLVKCILELNVSTQKLKYAFISNIVWRAFMSSCYSDYEFKNLYKDWFIYIKYNKRIPILQKCCMYISVQGFHTVALIFFKIYAKGLYILKKSIKKMT